MSAHGNESVANSDPKFSPPGFRSRGASLFYARRGYFSAYFPSAPKPRRHMVITGANHTFDQWPHRKHTIREP